jgi:hypothetical protein
VIVQPRNISGIDSEQSANSPIPNSAASIKSQESPALSSGSSDRSLTSAAPTGKLSFSISPLTCRFCLYVCFELDSKKKSQMSIWSWERPGRGRERVFSDKNYRNGPLWGCGRRSVNQDSTPACVRFCSGLRRIKESFAMFCMSAKDLAP